MPPSRRGVQDIRTYAGRATAPGSTHRTYIRLSTLEMERTRRQHEFDTAQARADLAWERVRKLEAEIAELIASLGGRVNAVKPAQMVDPKPGSLNHAYGVKRAARVRAATQRKGTSR
jgi:hypothetical protein